MSAASGLSYATPPMTSSPILLAVLTAVDVTGEDKENQAPREIIDLTGDSKGEEEEIPDRAEDSGWLITIEDGENLWPIPVPPPASERLLYTTTMGQRCVRSSSPIRSSATPDAFPQVVRRLRHKPYQGTQLRLPRGSRPLRALARIYPSSSRSESYSPSSNSSVSISSDRATSPPGP